MSEQAAKANKHLSRVCKNVGGVSAHEGQIEAWGAGSKRGFMSLEHKR